MTRRLSIDEPVSPALEPVRDDRATLRGILRISRRHRQRRGGFSLPELLAVLAVVAVMVTVVLMMVSGVQTSSLNTKLLHDVEQVNTAIQIYEAAGGSLAGLSDPQQVLNRMKTIASRSGGKDREILFLKQSMIDPRLVVVNPSDTRKSFWSFRSQYVRYDASIRRFIIVDEPGNDGFLGFDNNEQIGEETALEEERTWVWKQAKTSGWVWESDAAPTNSVVTAPPGEVPVDDTATSYVPPNGPDGPNRAAPPTFDPAPPQLSLAVYPITVALTNPNNSAITRILYHVEPAGVQDAPYSGPIVVAPGDRIVAYVQSLDETTLEDSTVAIAEYTPTPTVPALGDNLLSSYTYSDLGGAMAAGSAAPTNPAPAPRIALANGDAFPNIYENDSTFRVYWTFDGSSPASSATRAQGTAFSNGYPGDALPLQTTSFGSGSSLTVSYYAHAVNPAIAADSAVVSKSVAIGKITLPPPLITSGAGSTPAKIQVTLSPNLATGKIPAGYRIYYRTDGIDPGNSGGEPTTGAIAYTAPFEIQPSFGSLTRVMTRCYGPTGAQAWFNPSAPASNNFNGLAAAADFFAVTGSDTLIYALDPVTGTNLPLTTSAPFSIGAVAFDQASRVVYYTENSPSGAWRVGKYTIGTSTHLALGDLKAAGWNYIPGTAANNLAFYDSALWYLAPGTDDVVKVTFNAEGTAIASQAKRFDLTANSTAFSVPGDLALASNGWCYFTDSVGGNRLHRFNLRLGNGYSAIGNVARLYPGLDYFNNVLFGAGSNGSSFDTVVPTSGAGTAAASATPARTFTDFAGPSNVPAPPPAAAFYACVGGDANIYAVDPATGANGLYIDGAPFNLQALAFDATGGNIFYLEDASGTATEWRLGKYSQITGLHSVIGNIKSGQTYNPTTLPRNLVYYSGSLYFIAPGTDDLVRIQLDATAAAISSQSKLVDLTGNAVAFTDPGDAVVEPTGMLFWSNTEGAVNKLYAYDIVARNHYREVGTQTKAYGALGIYNSALFGAAPATDDNIDVITLNSGAGAVASVSAPSRRFVDFAGNVNASLPGTSTLWAIVHKNGPHLVSYLNYKNTAGAAVSAIDWGEIRYNNASVATSFGTTTKIESFTITEGGIGTFFWNEPLTISGTTYGRLGFQIDVLGLRPGDPVVARAIGDAKAIMETVKGAALDDADRIGGVAIGPDRHVYAVYRKGSTADVDYLLRFSSLSADASLVFNDITSVGPIVGASGPVRDATDIAFHASGECYVADDVSDRVVIVDPATANVTSVQSSHAGVALEALAMSPIDNDLVAATTGGPLGASVVKVNAGSETWTSYFNYASLFGHTETKAVAFVTWPVADPILTPTLWGVTGGDGKIYSINPATGANALDTTAPFNIQAIAGSGATQRLYYVEETSSATQWRVGVHRRLIGDHDVIGNILASGYTYVPATRPQNLEVYNNDLYFIAPGTDDLVRIHLGTGWSSIESIVKIADMTGNAVTFADPGDLAIEPTGLVFFTNASKLYRFDLNTATYTLIGNCTGNWRGLCYLDGSFYGSRASSTQLDRADISTGGAISTVTASPARTFVDLASPAPAVTPPSSDSVWAIAESATQGRLIEFKNYSRPAEVFAVDYGPLSYINGLSTTVFPGGDTKIEAFAIAEDGSGYFVRNSPTTVDGVSYGRPMFRVDCSASLGTLPAAEFIGDLDAALNSMKGSTITSSDFKDIVAGLAIGTDGYTYALFRTDGDAVVDKLFRIGNGLVDTSGNMTGWAFIGNITGAGESCLKGDDLEFAPDGTLYVADAASGKTFIVNPETAAILSVYSTEAGKAPHGLAIHPSFNDFVQSEASGQNIGRVVAGTSNDSTYFNYQSRFGFADVPGISFWARTPNLPVNITANFFANRLGRPNIYRVDPSTGQNVRLTNAASYNIRALAYDEANNAIYYTEDDNDDSPALGKYLISSNTHVQVSSNLRSWVFFFSYRPSSSPSNLVFFNNALWYIDANSDDLVKIQLNAGGTSIVNQTKVLDLTNDAMAFNVGDLAIGDDGWMYWTDETSTGNKLYKFNIRNENGFAAVSGTSGMAHFDALAFYSGQLYGARRDGTQVEALTAAGVTSSTVPTNPSRVFIDYAAPVVSTTTPDSDPVFVAGDLFEQSGSQRGIMKLNADGTVSSGFSPGSGVNSGSYVRALAVQSNGRPVIGGNFTTFNGYRRTGLARLNTDGSIDAGFAPIITTGAPSGVTYGFDWSQWSSFGEDVPLSGADTWTGAKNAYYGLSSASGGVDGFGSQTWTNVGGSGVNVTLYYSQNMTEWGGASNGSTNGPNLYKDPSNPNPDARVTGHTTIRFNNDGSGTSTPVTVVASFSEPVYVNQLVWGNISSSGGLATPGELWTDGSLENGTWNVTGSFMGASAKLGMTSAANAGQLTGMDYFDSLDWVEAPTKASAGNRFVFLRGATTNRRMGDTTISVGTTSAQTLRQGRTYQLSYDFAPFRSSVVLPANGGVVLWDFNSPNAASPGQLQVPAVASTPIVEVTWGHDGLTTGIHRPGVSGNDARLNSPTGTPARSFGGWDEGGASYNTATRTALWHTRTSSEYIGWRRDGGTPAATTGAGETDTLSFAVTFDPDTVGALSTLTFKALRAPGPGQDINISTGAGAPSKMRVYAYYLNGSGVPTAWYGGEIDLTGTYSPLGGNNQYQSYSIDISGLSGAINALPTAFKGGRKIFFDLYAYRP